MPEYVTIATWPFGEAAVRAAAELLESGQPALDAAIAGAQAVEDDPLVDSVGYGGMPNAAGTVQLDACVMDGKTLSCGAVAGVENIRHPTALARLVMDKTPHVLLVGEGARLFAVEQGFSLENLTTSDCLKEWEKRRDGKQQPHVCVASGKTRGGNQRKLDPREGDAPIGHDTVTVLALDRHGCLGGACSTSGLALKLPGRVGDSPIIGAGLYVDNSAGAGGGTGVGEEIIRVCGSLLIVEALRAGRTPQEACELAIRKVNAVAVRRGVQPAPRVAFIALDPKGNTGAACTQGGDFDYAVARPGKVEMFKAREVGG